MAWYLRAWRSKPKILDKESLKSWIRRSPCVSRTPWQHLKSSTFAQALYHVCFLSSETSLSIKKESPRGLKLLAYIHVAEHLLACTPSFLYSWMCLLSTFLWKTKGLKRPLGHEVPSHKPFMQWRERVLRRRNSQYSEGRHAWSTYTPLLLPGQCGTPPCYYLGWHEN